MASPLRVKSLICFTTNPFIWYTSCNNVHGCFSCRNSQLTLTQMTWWKMI